MVAFVPDRLECCDARWFCKSFIVRGLFFAGSLAGKLRQWGSMNFTLPSLDGIRVAVLVTDGFEETEFTEPIDQLERAGAMVEVITPDEQRQVRAWSDEKADWSEEHTVDLCIADADVEDYDALILPGGVLNPDTLRTDEEALEFVEQFQRKGLLVAAICHAPQILVNAIDLKDRKVTSFESVREDLENAGAEVVDQSVVVHDNLITSRNPGDLDEFIDAIAELLVMRSSVLV